MASTSRRVIPVKQQQQTAAAQQAGLLKSSLDIVWSYSRSQAFFGSNLPSSPSFVQRYRRPGRDSDDDGDEASFGSSSRRSKRHSRDSTGEGTTEEEGSEDDEEDSESAEDGDEHWVPELEGTGNPQQQPLFAGATKSTQKKRRRSSSKRHSANLSNRISGNSLGLSDEPVYKRPASFTPIHTGTFAPPRDSSAAGSSAPHLPASAIPMANERTPLLVEKPGPNGSLEPMPMPSDAMYGSSPPEAVPFPRKSPHLKKRRLSERKRQSSYVHEGSSTSGQTLFNAINVLVGIGILAQPLAFSQAGWVLGVLLLLFCSALTNYTAKILARALADDPSLMTYADIGAKAFGGTARNFINALFCLEISALCVALIVLLGDSLSIVFSWPPWTFKLIGFAVIFPTLFLPLRYLSIASLIGIISVVTLTVTVLVDGSISHSQPGSLRHPMPTSVGPNWRDLPISFGLIMSGFGGHAVFPSLARDMKRPKDFNKVCDLAFVVATACYLLMAVVGYLMFGNTVSDEITRDLMQTAGLPRKLNLVAVCMVAITPLCKYSISQSPLESTIAYLLGVEETPTRLAMKSGSSFKGSDFGSSRRYSHSSFSDENGDVSTPRARVSQVNSSAVLSAISQPLQNAKPSSKAFARLVVKVVTGFVLLAIAIFVPSFDKVMGLLGAFSVFMICAIMPLAADIGLHRKTMSRSRLVLNHILLVLSIIGAAVGTVWIFLPKRK